MNALKTLSPEQHAAVVALVRRARRDAEREGYRRGYEDAVCGQASPALDDDETGGIPEARSTAVSACAGWLSDALRFGARPTTEVEAEARAAGHSRRAVKRARSALGVRAERRDGQWWVRLPE